MNEFECPLNQPVYAVLRVSRTDVGARMNPDILIGEIKEFNDGRNTPAYHRFCPYTQSGKPGTLKLVPCRFAFFKTEDEAMAYAYEERVRCLKELSDLLNKVFPGYGEGK